MVAIFTAGGDLVNASCGTYLHAIIQSISSFTAPGAAIPLKALKPGEAGDDEFERFFQDTVSAIRPAVLTTAGDVVSEAAVKRLARVSQFINQT